MLMARIDLAHEADMAIGPLAVHPSTREVTLTGRRQVIEPRVMQVLVALAQAKGAVVSKDDLTQRCWDGRVVGEDAINRVISRLRRLSEESGAFRVETVTRVGYRLITGDGPPQSDVEAADDKTLPQPRFHLGRRSVIAGGVGLTAAAAAGVWTVVRRPASGEIKSVAVIPFRALNGPEQKYFSEGLSQEISVELASLPLMKVIAPTSVSLAVEKGGALGDVANRLGVKLILSGSVQRQGDNLRITCELVDAKTAYTIWTDSFDRKAQDIFDIQSEIARQVAGIVSVQAAPASSSPGGDRTDGGTRNADAYDAYLRGADLLERGLGEVSDRAAATEFERALEHDPKFARARAELAMTYASIGMYSSPTPAIVATNMTKALQLAREAVALAPQHPIVNVRLAYILTVARYDFASASRFFDRALRLGPGLAIVQSANAIFSALVGHAGPANAAIEKAIEIDPLNPARRRIAAQVALLNHDYQRVVSRAADALAIDPHGSLVNRYLGDALVMLGRFNDARDAYRAEPANSSSWTGQAITSFRLGEADVARKWQERLVSKFGNSVAYQQAQIWTQWGETAKAVAALETAWLSRDTGLTLILRDPLLIPLGNNAGYRAIVNRMLFV